MIYGPVEGGAMERILGMSSNVPGSFGGTTRCSESFWRRCFGAEVMAGCVGETMGWDEALRLTGRGGRGEVVVVDLRGDVRATKPRLSLSRESE